MTLGVIKIELIELKKTIDHCVVLRAGLGTIFLRKNCDAPQFQPHLWNFKPGKNKFVFVLKDYLRLVNYETKQQYHESLAVIHCSDKMIRNRTVYRLLMLGGIHPNPGPVPLPGVRGDLGVRTLNCNGLGEVAKMRRLLHKVNSEVKGGGIVLLQETHVVDESLIGRYWRMNFYNSCVSTQSAGVLTLYDNSFKCLESYKDNGGRLAIVVIESDIEKFIVVNVYVPCDPVIGLQFMELVLSWKAVESVERNTT